MLGQGPEDARIVIVGEAPGRDEDREMRPFVGVAGRTLTKGLSEAGIVRGACWLTNVIGCRPPSNKITSPEGQEAVLLC